MSVSRLFGYDIVIVNVYVQLVIINCDRFNLIYNFKRIVQFCCIVIVVFCYVVEVVVVKWNIVYKMVCIWCNGLYYNCINFDICKQAVLIKDVIFYFCNDFCIYIYI